jgi:hypothetical protein
MSVKNEMYFCLHLTENEHHVVEDMVRRYCVENNLDLLYYRKLKDGHKPMYREVKVLSRDPMGLGRGLGYFSGWLAENLLDRHIERNPHKVKR